MRINTDQGILPQSVLHIIRPNDTFYELAKAYNTTVQNIIAINPLLNPHNLQIGIPILISPGINWQNEHSQSLQDNVQQEQRTPVISNRVHPIQRPYTQEPFDGTWLTDNSDRSNEQQPIQQPQPQIIDNTNTDNVLPPQIYSNIPTFPYPMAPRAITRPVPVTPIQPSMQPIIPNPVPIEPIIPINPQLPEKPVPPKLVETCCNSSLCGQMRLLWSQKIYWTRMLLNSIVYRTDQVNANMQRLLSNPLELGSLFARYYGNPAGQQIANLYNVHINIIRDMVTAIRDNRTVEASRLQNLWYNNADEAIELLTSLENNLNEDELRKAVYQHLENTELQIVQSIGNNIADSINTFNNLEIQAMDLADLLSNAILGIKPTI